MKLINVGIIGLGVIGKRMAQNMGVHPKFNILGGYDISEKKNLNSATVSLKSRLTLQLRNF